MSSNQDFKGILKCYLRKLISIIKEILFGNKLTNNIINLNTNFRLFLKWIL